MLAGLVRTAASRLLGSIAPHTNGTPKPRQMYLDPTYHCNLRCISCHSPQVATHFHSEKSLSLEEYGQVLAQFAEMGGRELHVYGGEPLLVAQIFDILALAKVLGLEVHLCTNGLLLDAKRSTRLVEIGLANLTISIDGVGDVYESIRGRGKFPALVDGIRTFQGLNSEAAGRPPVPVGFHVTVMRQNVGNLIGVLHLAKEFNVRRVSYALAVRVAPSVNSATQAFFGASFRSDWNHWELPRDILITDEQLPQLSADVANLTKEADRLGIDVWLDPALSDAQAGHCVTESRFRLTKKCTVADRAVFLGPSGSTTLCPMLTHYPVANARESTLTDYWVSNAPLVKLREHLREGHYLPTCENCCNHGGLI